LCERTAVDAKRFGDDRVGLDTATNAETSDPLAWGFSGNPEKTVRKSGLLSGP
jgi:hypothetical protein